MQADPTHRWRFFRAGGLDHVQLDSAPDLAHLEDLDQKLWAALSCPVRGLELDARTLGLIDLDGDGHVHAEEVMAAVQWAEERVKDLGLLVDERRDLPLAAIDDGNEAGRILLASARRILSNLGKPEAESIRVAEASDQERIFADSRFNGDGIVHLAAAGDDDEVRRVLQEILDLLGAEDDRSGAPGVSREKAERFFGELRSLAEWWQEGMRDAGRIYAYEVDILGDVPPVETAKVAAAVDAVREKVDDYFARCRLAAFDPRAADALDPHREELRELASKTVSATDPEIEALPLARIEADRPLPLGTGLNPAWAERIERMVELAAGPPAGDASTLSGDAWNRIKDRIAPYREWQAAKPETAVEELGIERVQALLAGDLENRIDELLARDEAVASEVEAFVDVEKLARYHRDLYTLLKNFVSFSDFYDADERATFQAGTLYLDGRACELCVRVEDPAKHARLAAYSDFHLAYLDCRRIGEQMKIAAAFTNGSGGSIRVGRNGLFYDRDGRDWDATITQVIENPISLSEAFWSPYRRAGAFAEEQIKKFAASSDQAVAKSTGKTLASAPKAGDGDATEARFDIAKFAGIFAAIGLALGAIGTAFAAVVSGFLGLELWQMPLAVGGVLLAISGPSVLLAAVKLRKRNLGPILDANGWAVNGDVRVNIPFGASLTKVAELPRDAERTLRDPFPHKRRLWLWLLLAALLLAAGWWLHETGRLDVWGIGAGEPSGVAEEGGG